MSKDVRELTLKAKREEDKLFMRTNLATANFEDGRQVDIDANVNCDSILIGMKDPKKEGWVTYVISVEEFVEAALKAEGWE